MIAIGATLEFIEGILTRNSSAFWVILGVILSILVTVTAESALTFINRPVLHIRDYFTLSSGKGRIKAVFVENVGRSAAQHCNAVLKVHDIGEDALISASIAGTDEPLKQYPEDGDIHANLRWETTTESGARDLNRDETAILRLYREQDEFIVVPSELGFSTPACILAKRGAPYDATLQITANDTKAVVDRLSLSFE